MLILVNTTDSIELITSSTATVDVHASYADHTLSTDNILTNRKNTAISTITTTPIVVAPSSGDTRNVKTLNIRNRSSATAVDVTVQYNQNSTLFQLHSATLRAGEALEYVEGVGFFTLAGPIVATPVVSTADQAVGASVTVYLTGSAITIPAGSAFRVGSIKRWRFVVNKTAAGTAAATFDVRFGTTGTTSDTSRLNFTTGTQTAALDVGVFEIQAITQGPIGASNVEQGSFRLTHNLATTGWAVIAGLAQQAASAAFDITAVTVVGVSITTGASHAYTVQSIVGEIFNI